MALEFLCKDCPDRQPGCHDRCIQYLKAKAKNDIVRKRIKESKKTYPSHLTFTKKNNGNARCTQLEWQRQRESRKNYIKEF